MSEFKHLKTVPLATISRIQRPQVNVPVTVSSPATAVLTDFSLQQPLVLEHTTTIDEAEALMKKTHVRLKLVVDARDAFKGVVSLADLLSVKVMQAVKRTGVERSELTVESVMTKKDAMLAVDIASLKAAKIGDLLLTMQSFGDQHVLVVDGVDGSIRGLVSASDIARRLNIPVTINERANSLAQIYQAVRQA
ncbi:CBS domain-containing protein [Congregibacter sp.]|uniref:CBS domain-containing protein n=1 Tax=Congregibacter sp. TaxID=2744308 RepID=UPI0039E62FFE